MKYTPNIIVNEDIAFTIPLYQRLFEWNTDNVKQLLDDLNSAFEKYESAKNNSDNDYYIGMLTSTTTGNNEKKLFLVDGQQRFTVMTLIACVMQHYTHDSWSHFLLTHYGKPRLSFVSRRSDDMYLMKLIQKDFEYDGELVNYNMKEAIKTIREYMEKFAKDKAAFANYIFEYLSFFVSELPNNYSAQDLNKYFERMNSSGKNLEHHEILKVKILSKIGGNVSLYMQLWNKIADVDTVLLRKREYENETDYNERKNKVLRSHLEDIEAIPGLVNSLKNEDNSGNNKIKQIKKREKKPQDTNNNHFNGSRSVLRFPQLLLQTLYFYLKQKQDKDFSPRLDDFFNQNKLLETFQKYLPYEGGNVDNAKLKEYFELLLHCRVAMDVCFVRSLEYGYSLDMNLPEDNKDVKELLMFESFLYVSSTNVTNYRWFGWLMNFVLSMSKDSVPSPNDLFNELKSKCDALNKLPQYCKLIFGEDIRYWFWRLDFYIWQHRKELFSNEEDSIYLNIVENYVFIRNRSIEHIAPQYPKIESKLQWYENDNDHELLNCFGNLVMISQGLNSALSNSSFEEKKAHVESYFNSVNGTIESLKLLMVYRDYSNKWDKECIPVHGSKMYSFLESEIEKNDIGKEEIENAKR